MTRYGLKSAVFTAAVMGLAIAVLPASSHAQSTGARLDALEKSVKSIEAGIKSAGTSGENPAEQLEKTFQLLDERLRRIEQQIRDVTIAIRTLQTGGGPAGVGEAPESELNAERDERLTWTRDEGFFDPPGEEGAANAGTANAGAGNAAAPAVGDVIASLTTGDADNAAAPRASDAAQEAVANAPDTTLTDAEIEVRFNDAIKKALADDLEGAEAALAAFIESHPGHERHADAQYWLGRVQFLGKKYAEAARSFNRFQQGWPADSRIEQTTLWIGESVVNIASPDDACQVLENLTSLVEDPSDEFIAGLAELKATARCGA